MGTESKSEFESDIAHELNAYMEYRKNNKRLNLPDVTSENRQFLLDIRQADNDEDKLNILNGVELEGWVFINIGLPPHNLRDRELNKTTWFSITQVLDFGNSSLIEAKFIAGNLTHTNFKGANLTDAHFVSCGFTNPRFSKAKFDNVELTRIIFKAGYEPIQDDTDQVHFGWKSFIFDWGKLRFLSAIPLFSVAWTTLLLSLAAMNVMGWVNIHSESLSSVTDRLPMPTAIIQLFLSSLLLAVASTIYRSVCPARIQEFSETEWVEKHNFPRLKYFEHRFAWAPWKKASIIMIYIFGITGLIMSVHLVYQRAGFALCYTMNYATPERCHD